ncbi:MAG: cell division protein ZapA [Candidatus Goldbacteria bacterium]|nr:cell division protein ZapA [Candidatus Goldiibacteriota bacterium]
MDKSVITVNIFGNEYTIKGVAEPEYITSLAAYINNKMTEVQYATGLKDTKKIAILAAINLADELFEAKKNLKEKYIPKEQFQAVRNRVENLISMIDKELPSGIIPEKESESGLTDNTEYNKKPENDNEEPEE